MPIPDLLRPSLPSALACALLPGPPALRAQAPSIPSTPFEDADQIRAWLQAQKVPVLGLGLLRDGRLVEARVYGEIGGHAAPVDTLFNVASLTKPVTALVALRLVSQGKLDLDEPLSRYWVDPDLKGDPRVDKLTARLVLSHQTGFPNWRWEDPSKKLRFTSDPGARYQYSGEGLEYLRRALEAKFKTSLPQLARTLIFEPLGMRDTRFTWDAQMDAARFAPGCDEQGKPYPFEKWTEANAADQLITSVEDYGRFLAAVMDGRLLSERVQQEMLRPQVATEKGKAFGLGWERYDLGHGDICIDHGGADQGVRTQVFLFPRQGKGLILFTTSESGTSLYAPLLLRYMGVQGRQVLDIEMGKK